MIVLSSHLSDAVICRMTAHRGAKGRSTQVNWRSARLAPLVILCTWSSYCD